MRLWIVSLLCAVGSVKAFRSLPPAAKLTRLSMLTLSDISQVLCDTSISEEEVLSVTGQTTELPDPLLAVVFAAVVFAGVGVLQFSLGDLNKQEGQARVRDFLQTKRETERKRGYFD